MGIEQSILEILDQVFGRHLGKYEGTVVEVEPGGRGRIKAMVPAVLRDTPSGWCEPCVPYAGPQVGFAFLPEVGSGVWIEFRGGDSSHPIWTGCYWRDGELPPAVTPAKKLIRTKAGHQILLDDDAGSITITDASGNTITLDGSGIALVSGSGKVVIADSKVTVNDGAVEVE